MFCGNLRVINRNSVCGVKMVRYICAERKSVFAHPRHSWDARKWRLQCGPDHCVLLHTVSFVPLRMTSLRPRSHQTCSASPFRCTVYRARDIVGTVHAFTGQQCDHITAVSTAVIVMPASRRNFHNAQLCVYFIQKQAERNVVLIGVAS
jgi:hypothetical protein